MDNETQTREPKRTVRDLPHLIKWILLIILLVLLAAEIGSGEFEKMDGPDGGLALFILILKLILIAGLIFLLRIQRSVRCELLEPVGCTAEVPDVTQGILTIDVRGTAAGAAFNVYTLEIQKDGDPPESGITSYPGGAGSGTSPVVNGFLGSFNTTSLSDGAYTITLRVFPVGSGSPAVCTTTFNLLKIAVWINSVAGSVPTTHILDENAELGVGSDIHSFGGPLNINGSAYVYECDDRKVESVEMRYARIAGPGSAPTQPATDAAIPADWPTANQLHAPLVYSDLPPPTKYTPWTRIGMAPTRLINDWGTCTVFSATYSRLLPRSWQSRQATDGGNNMGGGKYSLLLITEDTDSHRYFDVQKVWLDNWPVVAKFVRFERPGAEPGTWIEVPNCTDVLMSWNTLRLVGLAWDALIDPAFPPTTDPNDNFDKYSLSYRKQFVGGPVSIPIPAPNTRVPNNLSPAPGPLVADADAGVLADWDLTGLDAGNQPSPGDCSNPGSAPHSLYRGCECTYILTLGVSDTTITQNTGEHNIHNPVRQEAVKIINDL